MRVRVGEGVDGWVRVRARVLRFLKLPGTGTGTTVPVRFQAVEMEKEAVPTISLEPERLKYQMNRKKEFFLMCQD